MIKIKPIIRKITLAMLAVLSLTACQGEFDMTEPQESSPGMMSPLTRALQDKMTLNDFRRCYGVGYSYDGIWGEPCNLPDVRSRVIDFGKLEEYRKKNNYPLFSSFTNNDVTYDINESFSHSDYKHSSVFTADVKAKVLMFNGEVSGTIGVWEQGETNEYICDVSYVAPNMTIKMEDADIAELVNDNSCDYRDLLTPNFREAVEWMAHHTDNATIDSFLVCYGSHVVTRASLGGSITISMTLQLDSLLDLYDNKVLGEAAIASIFKTSSESEQYKKELNLLNSADCNVTIKGGDLGMIPNELLRFQFGKCPDLSEIVKDWAESLNYDVNDYADNNLEILRMEYAPIWDFIPDKDVADRVRWRVEGCADEHNFASTSFRLPESVSCKMGGEDADFASPAIVNVIAAGRYVATICRESIKLPDAGDDEVSLQVVYPVYSQRANLSCGYATHDGKAYKVRWINGRCYVEKDTINTPFVGDTIYLTYGVAGSVKFCNVKYQNSHCVVGYEWPMSIDISGGIDNQRPYYLAYKEGTQFLLRDADGSEQKGKLEGLPNWTYDEKQDRMVRNNVYYYYWNPNEVNYE